MPITDPDKRRRRDRDRHRRRYAERSAAGLCTRCGASPAEADRRLCGSCADEKRLADRARAARRRAAGIPRHRDPEKARSAERERYRRRTEERIEQGLCLKCGRSDPEPGFRLCRSCGEQRRRYEKARYAEASNAGELYGGKSTTAKRRSARRRGQRRRQARKASGRCVRCGQVAPLPAGASCEPCLAKRRAAERAIYAARQAAGCCLRCGAVTFEGASACGPCAVVEAGRRPRRTLAARQRYAARRKRWLCTACARPSGGASRCEDCARKSWARSEHVRGLPLYPPGCTVVDAVTGDVHATFQSWEDAVLYLSLDGIQLEDVELLVDRSPMATLTAAPWE